MSVRIGRISHEDRHKPRLRTGEPREHRGSYRHVYGQRLFGYAQLLLPDSVAAAEVVDSVLEAAAERDAMRGEAGALPPGGDEAQAGDNLRALMYAAVRRECRKRRLASGWASYASEPEVLPAKTSVGGLGAENIGVASITAVQRYLQAAAMTQVLAGLPERQREMLNLAFWHGLSPDELGTIFAIPVRLAEKELASACARFASLVAVVVLLQSGRSDCPDLDGIIVGSFAETPGYELCREVGTHSLECATCSNTVASRGLGPLRVEDLPTVDLNPDLDRQLASFAQSLDSTPRARVPLWGGGEGRASARSGAARLGQSLLRRLDPPADAKSPSPSAWQGRARLLGAAASALAVVGIVAGVMVLGKFTITPATEANGSSALQLSGAPSGPGGAQGSGQAGQFQAQRPGAPNSTLPIFTSPGPPSMSSSPPAGTQPSSPAPTPSGSSPARHTKSPKPSRSPSSPPPPPPTSPPPFSTSPPPTSPAPDPSSTAPAPAQSSASDPAATSSPS